MLLRRSLLATLFAPLVATPAAAAEPVDPILSAIARAEAADAELTNLLKDLDEDDADAMQRANEATDRSSDAMNALAAIIPTTPAGLRTLVRHYAAEVAKDDPHSVGAYCLAHLARCAGNPPRYRPDRSNSQIEPPRFTLPFFGR